MFSPSNQCSEPVSAANQLLAPDLDSPDLNQFHPKTLQTMPAEGPALPAALRGARSVLFRGRFESVSPKNDSNYAR